MDKAIEYFAIADVPGLTPAQSNAINLWLRTNKVPMHKRIRNIYVEKSNWQKAHRRQRRCNYYQKDEAIQALIQETKQKLVLSSRQTILNHLGVYA